MMPRILGLFLLISLAGCITSQPQINVQTIKSWENHYLSVDEFKSGTHDITLDKNESIWVLSNKSLSRLLKDMMQSHNSAK